MPPNRVQNTYGERDRIVWPSLVIATGSLAMIWGIVILVLDSEPYYLTPGFVMTGLGLVCFSILSKVGLLALVLRSRRQASGARRCGCCW